MGSLLTISVGLGLIGWALIFWAAASQRVQEANTRADKAEQLARDADARTDKAIELWNDERADHTRDREMLTAQLEVVRDQALTTVAQYRHALEQLAALVRKERDADDNATGVPPPRVM